MPNSRRGVLKAGLALGIASAVGGGAWELSKVKTKANIIISGGGAAGIGIANKLLHHLNGANITVIDPRNHHWYQPGQTLLLAGAYKTREDVISSNQQYLSNEINWLSDEVVEYQPDSNQVKTRQGQTLSYDYLIVATGLELRYDKIEGLDTTQIGQDNIASIYYSPEAGITSHKQALAFAQSKGGQALFTRPQGAMKCAGAPMKATNLVEFFVRQAGNRDAFNFEYLTSEPFLFSVQAFNERLKEIWQTRKINANFEHTLIGIDSAAKTATFRNSEGESRSLDWEFIHVVPPMSAVKSLRESELADNVRFKGYLEVDKHSMQHTRYPNVFGVGDTVGTPIGKTAASVKSQIPVVAENIRSLIEGREPTAAWGGYTSCPMILDVGHAMLWEFDYSMQPMTALPFEVVDPLAVSELAWVMEKSLIRPVYDIMLHGYTPV
ncbi:FAD-dependent oxidoreductase [uncultured Neptuniibacter sp.]|uniref:NAD(P)/FAD-dependent oxidoreductase n=1 Tax=uncultured Neptuniibacter sp. TaxID=502143 RepID=UPI00260BA753|nr:FAD-dependent oxidoreductase [uncultured Neptuniibacter sp.]